MQLSVHGYVGPWATQRVKGSGFRRLGVNSVCCGCQYERCASFAELAEVLYDCFHWFLFIKQTNPENKEACLRIGRTEYRSEPPERPPKATVEIIIQMLLQ